MFQILPIILINRTPTFSYISEAVHDFMLHNVCILCVSGVLLPPAEDCVSDHILIPRTNLISVVPMR